MRPAGRSWHGCRLYSTHYLPRHLDSLARRKYSRRAVSMRTAPAPSHILSRGLAILGLGISGPRHLTVEAVEYLRRAQKVLTLSAWSAELHQFNNHVTRLNDLYWSDDTDWNTYQRIARTVVRHARRGPGLIIFAVDGNPAVFDDIVWESYRLCRRAELPVTIVPGISSLDVLPIALRFDPGNVGLQIMEANQLVVYDLVLNPHLATLVLQVGWFGSSILRKRRHQTRRALDPLVNHLLKFYPKNFPAFFVFDHRQGTQILKTSVASIALHSSQIHPGMTLYLPRKEVKIIDRRFYHALFRK